jgi:hypothetical protein
MDRFVLGDARWARMEPHCLGKATDPGRSGSDNRLFLEGGRESGDRYRYVSPILGNSWVPAGAAWAYLHDDRREDGRRISSGHRRKPRSTA